MKYTLTAIALSTMLTCQAQNSNWEKVEIKTTILTEYVIMLEGQGGNIGFINSKDLVAFIFNSL